MERYLQLIVTVALIALIVFLRWPKKTKSAVANRDILIWGLPGSFKTRLYFKLLANRILETITSSTTNTQSFQLGQHVYSITDFPGHPRFERDLVGSLKDESPVVFMIDAEKK
jgi:hypothetical protein